ncbi:MAG: helix-turn-helix transcriptional regulator [Pirellulales bacterium]|nr:helix-turn-helix transcriptional regulator [Pirellulales bacterium]
MDKTNCQAEYEFSLVLTGVDSVTDEAVNKLYENGCDDATISVRSGRVYTTFARRASSIKDAILSAIKDVREAGIGADVLRVDECNLVTQAEIARRTGRSRQQINQFIAGTRGPGGFPGPACHICDDHPLWYWCEVSYWLWENDMIPEAKLREAETIEIINNILEFRHQQQLRPELAEEIISLISAS